MEQSNLIINSDFFVNDPIITLANDFSKLHILTIYIFFFVLNSYVDILSDKNIMIVTFICIIVL